MCVCVCVCVVCAYIYTRCILAVGMRERAMRERRALHSADPFAELAPRCAVCMYVCIHTVRE